MCAFTSLKTLLDGHHKQHADANVRENIPMVMRVSPEPPSRLQSSPERECEYLRARIETNPFFSISLGKKVTPFFFTKAAASSEHLVFFLSVCT